MNGYYYVGGMIEDVEWGTTPSLPFQEMVRLLEEGLSAQDKKAFHEVRLLFDIENIRSFLRKEPLDSRGLLTLQDMERVLYDKEYFPDYVFSFLESHHTLEERLGNFSELFTLYFAEATIHAKGFLQWYFSFERELRLVLVALRAKALQRDLLIELQYEDPEDPVVEEILVQKDAPVYQPPEDFLPVKEMFEKTYGDPYTFFQQLAAFRFSQISEQLPLFPFSFDRILGETIKGMFVEEWLRLDEKKGKELLEEII